MSEMNSVIWRRIIAKKIEDVRISIDGRKENNREYRKMRKFFGNVEVE